VTASCDERRIPRASILARWIKRGNPNVAPNRRDRSKTRLECWVLSRFLVSELASELMPDHVFLRKSESPDFIIHSHDTTFGIEVSEIIHEVTAIARLESDRQCLDIAFAVNPDDFPTRASRRNIGIALRDPESGGFSGESPERQFAEITESVIHNKIVRSKKYICTDQRLLLLYNNTGLPLDSNIMERGGYNHRILNAAISARCSFAAVLIYSGGQWFKDTLSPQNKTG